MGSATVRVRTTCPRFRPVKPGAQTASRRRRGEGSIGSQGKARCRAAWRVASTSKTMQRRPWRSPMPPMESLLPPSATQERTKRFQTGTIHVSQDPAQAGAMGKTGPPKERHEGCPERNETLNEVAERAFSADGRAKHQSEKITRFLPAQASSHETDLMRESSKHLFLRQVASDDDVLARTMQALKADHKVRCEPQGTSRVSDTQRPPCEKRWWFLLKERPLFHYAACLLAARCVSRG
jgi:hypothetical protein